MELKEFLKMQKELDDYILVKNKEKREDVPKEFLAKHLLSCKILAAIVELGEYANELQGEGFKYWKNKKKSSKEIRLEEFVDVWHFMFSIANQEGFIAEEIEKAYKMKYQKNIQRQLEGY